MTCPFCGSEIEECDACCGEVGHASDVDYYELNALERGVGLEKLTRSIRARLRGRSGITSTLFTHIPTGPLGRIHPTLKTE